MLEGTSITPIKEAKVGGCQSGSCGTGGCNKLNVFNWLSDMALPPGQAPFDILEVRFKGSRKEFFRNKDNVQLAVGDVVAVEANPGHDVGIVSVVGELVRLQLKKKHLTESSDQIKALYRKAKSNEVEKWNQVKALEDATQQRARKIIESLKLTMKLSDVEYQGDGKKATFYYTADDRVDFRELIRRLADEFRVRVEMRQIGMRQEAGRLGGIGSCGRELCCSTWLVDFKTVSTSTARYQNLALNPAKLAGQCGKLKCCLNYELDSYLDALKEFPKTDISLHTEKGRASHRKTDIFKRLMWYAYDTGEGRDGGEPADGGDGGNWIMLPAERVKEIIDLNRQGTKPSELRGARDLELIEEVLPDYENVVGQDRIDRMDRKKKHKKKRRPDNRPQSAGQAGGQPQEGQAPGQPQRQGGGPRPEGQQRPQGQPRQQGGGQQGQGQRQGGGEGPRQGGGQGGQRQGGGQGQRQGGGQQGGQRQGGGQQGQQRRPQGPRPEGGGQQRPPQQGGGGQPRPPQQGGGGQQGGGQPQGPQQPPQQGGQPSNRPPRQAPPKPEN